MLDYNFPTILRAVSLLMLITLCATALQIGQTVQTEQLQRSADASQIAQAKSTTDQTAVLNKMLVQQIKSAVAESTNETAVKISTALAQQKQEERLAALEAEIAREAQYRLEASAAAQRSRDDIISRAEQVMGTVIGALIIWGTKGIYSMVIDARRHREDLAAKRAVEDAYRATQLSLDGVTTVMDTNVKSQDAKLEQIHILVNSSLTTSMQNELEVRKAYLVSLQNIVTLQERYGLEKNSDGFNAMISEMKDRILLLETQIADRLRRTMIGNELARNANP